MVITANVDGNGATRITSISIIKNETEETTNWYIDQFKEHFKESVPAMKTFLSDKDEVVRKSIRNKLGVNTYLCIFHVLKNFKQLVNDDPELRKDPDRANKCLKLLSSMMYAIHDDKFCEQYEIFTITASESVVTSFNKNWLPIKNQ